MKKVKLSTSSAFIQQYKRQQEKNKYEIIDNNRKKYILKSHEF